MSMDDDKLVLGAKLTPEPDRTDATESTDHSLITDLSDAMGLGSSSERARRRKQKLREALVREHIREREWHKSRLASLLGLGAKRG